MARETPNHGEVRFPNLGGAGVDQGIGLVDLVTPFMCWPNEAVGVLEYIVVIYASVLYFVFNKKVPSYFHICVCVPIFYILVSGLVMINTPLLCRNFDEVRANVEQI